MAGDDHSRLIREAARTALSPLGFQQKGRSRLWFADRDCWALVIEFQPSGFGKGSYLNIGATWFWDLNGDWPFNYIRRASGLVPFETTNQFRSETEKLAKLAAIEAGLLDKKFSSLDDIADHLKAEANTPWPSRNPWTLYHAAIVAGLTGSQEFSLSCFRELMKQNAATDWHREILDEAANLAKLVSEREKFRSAILAKVAEKRTRLRLPPLSDTA